MANTPTHIAPNGARLARLVSGFSSAYANAESPPFTERLAQLIDLPNSILILDTQGKHLATALSWVPTAGTTLKQQFLDTQAEIVESIALSFTLGCAPNTERSRIKLPVPSDAPPADTVAMRAAYVTFYTAHQRQIELKIQRLQAQVRDAVAGHSPRLSQLAKLDKVLGDTLLPYSKSTLAVLPRLVAQRFDHMLSDYPGVQDKNEKTVIPWTTVLQQYVGELREMLLAETETRLLPILGLIETINEDTHQNDYK